MKTIFVVYRESDAQNVIAFSTYDAAYNWIEYQYGENSDFYIDEVPFYNK